MPVTAVPPKTTPPTTLSRVCSLQKSTGLLAKSPVDFCSEQTRDNVVGGVVLGGTAVTGIIDIQH